MEENKQNITNEETVKDNGFEEINNSLKKLINDYNFLKEEIIKIKNEPTQQAPKVEEVKRTIDKDL